jgi:hypothetical protein
MLHMQDLARRYSSKANGLYQALGPRKRWEAKTQVLEQYIRRSTLSSHRLCVKVSCIKSICIAALTAGSRARIGIGVGWTRLHLHDGLDSSYLLEEQSTRRKDIGNSRR